MISEPSNNNISAQKKWADFLRSCEIKWEEHRVRTPKLSLLKPTEVQHDELLTVLINTGFRDSILWCKGLRAIQRKGLPIIDFKMEGEHLPYMVFIDDQGLVVLIQLYDNNESFKVLAESEWDVRKKPILAAAEIAMTVMATIETYLALAKIMIKLKEKGLVSDADISET